MDYRNDRDAWRQKTEQLEKELARAQHELSALKGGEQPASGTPPRIKPAKTSRAGWAASLILVAFVGAAAIALFLAGASPEILMPVVGLFVSCVMLAFAVFVLSHSLDVVAPNRTLVLSGRRHQQPDGTVTGYRVVRTGRVVRLPLLQTTQTLDLSLLRVETRLREAYSHGGIPLTVDLSAWIGVDPSTHTINNAAERLAGLSRDQIKSIASQAIESAAREVIAMMRPEEIIEGRLDIRDRIIEAADDSMRQLGLSLEAVFIQSLDDEQGYVNGLGRETIARALRDAEIRKSEARR